MQNGKASTGRDEKSCLQQGSRTYQDSPETAATGLLCELNIRNFCIIGCSHTVDWKLI